MTGCTEKSTFLPICYPMRSANSNPALLTPKGPYVPGVTKPVLVSVAWPHTIFRFFETYWKDVSRHKLRVSANFMILGAMVQKLWVFEVFGQGLAKAGMC
jgi:hypothetical protein